jgi:hypothetical protein
MSPPASKRGGPQRISTKSNCTVDAMRANPGALVAPTDLHAAGLIPSSYSALKRWRERGWLPAPIIQPNGFLRWRAGDVLQHMDLCNGPVP